MRSRIPTPRLPHERRNFEELTKDGTSPIGPDPLSRFDRIYEVEGKLKGLSDEPIASTWRGRYGMRCPRSSN